MPLELEPGLYSIFSTSGNEVGRHPVEDLSLNPEPVLAHPPSVKPLGPWQVERTANGHYRLSHGAPVAEERRLLWALLNDMNKDFDWEVTPKGTNHYIVKKPAHNVGWVAPASGEGQIAVNDHYTPFRFVRAVSKEAHGFLSAHETYFGGYIEIDGKKHLFSGTFDKSVRGLKPIEVLLEYCDVQQLNGIYAINNGHFPPLDLPLERGLLPPLRIFQPVGNEPINRPINGQLAWLPKKKE
ncbi:hypothetical protein APHAL10511_000005 [Amanita phalloides]|nr:hypothetical protein APHAL10511_000005 [Amanita phalloides]